MSEEISKDDAAIEFSMALRHDLVVSLTTDSAGAKRLPSDLDSIYAVRALLKDNDSSVISRKRLATDDATSANDRNAAEILERVIANLTAPPRDGVAAVPAGESRTKGERFSADNLPSFSLTEGATSAVGDKVDLDVINAAGRAVRKKEAED